MLGNHWLVNDDAVAPNGAGLLFEPVPPVSFYLKRQKIEAEYAVIVATATSLYRVDPNRPVQGLFPLLATHTPFPSGGRSPENHG